MPKTVYVVAWDCESSGGFDWYFKPEDADKAFEEEKKNADEFKANQWTAYRFDYEAKAEDNDEITQEIDNDLIELCDAAPIKYGYRT